MRNILRTFVVLVAGLVLTACAPSLHPFYTDEDIVFNDALLGEWVNYSGEKCKFIKTDADHYEFLFVDGEARSRFKARLIELGGRTYLDLYPELADHDKGLPVANLVRAHTLARVIISENSISIAMMNGDWIKRLSDQNNLNLSHERMDDGDIVLTAPTLELRAFVQRHSDDKEAFDDGDVFYRVAKNE